MLPTLRSGRIVVGLRSVRGLRSSGIIMIHHNQTDKIKRIKSIKEDRLFIVGDNPEHSLDSRTFGWVSADEVIGKVIWPRI